eukprot:365326-Chlamydomonas_euryale.AAC.17
MLASGNHVRRAVRAGCTTLSWCEGFGSEWSGALEVRSVAEPAVRMLQPTSCSQPTGCRSSLSSTEWTKLGYISVQRGEKSIQNQAAER